MIILFSKNTKTYLFFSNNNIQNKGFKLLSESIINQNSSLTILIVWNNNLDQGCSEYFVNLLVIINLICINVA